MSVRCQFAEGGSLHWAPSLVNSSETPSFHEREFAAEFEGAFEHVFEGAPVNLA